MVSIRLLYVVATQLIATVLTEWEIPFNISQHFLKVIGGYPTFIESFYPSVENLTGDDSISFPPPLQVSSYHRLLSWFCDAFPADRNECTSTINADRCRHGTQFAVGFWPAANRSCEKRGQMVPCMDATLEGNVCQNAVVEIRNASNAHFVLKDLPVPSIVTQTFTEYRTTSNTSCYNPAFPVLADQPLQLFPTDRCGTEKNLIRFGINTTAQCFVDRSAFNDVNGCPSDDQMKAALISDVSYICNCGRCETPILKQSSSTRDRNTTSCMVIHRATLTFTHSNGSINGAQIRYGDHFCTCWTDYLQYDGCASELSNYYDYRTVYSGETRILLTVRIRFVGYRAPCQFSRFELQRGRFHCPSEITCWQELWLPLLTDVSPSTVPLLGCAIITALYIAFATVKRKGKLLDPISDNHLTLSKKLQ